MKENWSKNRKSILVLMLMGIMISLLVLGARYSYRTMYYGESASIKSAYSFYDYFIMDVQNGEEVDSHKYSLWMNSAFAMYDGKEVVVDNRISESVMKEYCLLLIEYTQDDIGVLNRRIEDIELSGQTIYLWDADEKEHVLFMITGELWESSSLVKVFSDLDGNIIVAPDGLFTEADFVNKEVQLDVFARTKVVMQLFNDVTLRRIAGRGLVDKMIIRQILFVLFIASVGCIAGRAFLKRIGNMFIWFALPFGFINQILSTFILIVSHLPVNLLSYLAISYALAILINQLLKRCADDVQIHMEHDIKLLFSLLTWGGVVLWFCINPYVLLSADSVYNAYLGKVGAVTGDLNAILGDITSHALITPIFEVGSSLFGVGLNYSLQPILTIMFLVAIGWVWFSIMDGSTSAKIWIVLGTVIVVILNPMFYMQTFWKLNNLALGLFAAFMVGMHILYYNKREKLYFETGNLFLIVVGIARVESGLFLAIYLVCLFALFQNDDREREIEKLCFRMGLIFTAIYLYYLCVIGQVESPFWTPVKGLMVMASVWLVYILCIGSRILGKKMKPIFDNIDRIMFLCIGLSVLLLGILNKEKFIDNAKTFISNLLYYGGYWYVMLAVAILGVVLLKKDPIMRFLLLYMGSYFMFIPGLMIFRENLLRVGFGDSGCRMLSHIAVVGGFLLIYVVSALRGDQRLNHEEGRRNEGCKQE
ncbi:MAG: hypothetical protein NC417_00785 [Candidatus Gastranaerophilales bacterium]|nr:hypothetical protein [Candidatus Gastranaerophilales bacterium]